MLVIVILVPHDAAEQLDEGWDPAYEDSDSNSDSASRLCGLKQVASPLLAPASSDVRRPGLPLRS